MAGCAAGAAHSVAWTTCGRLFAWGRGEEGQLGLGDPGDAATDVATDAARRRAPRRVVGGGLGDEAVVGAACGPLSTIAWTAEGRLYAWGADREGSLGVGTVPATRRASGPASLESLLRSGLDAAGWGQGGPAGGNLAADVSGAGPQGACWVPRRVPGLEGLWVASASCGPLRAACVALDVA